MNTFEYLTIITTAIAALNTGRGYICIEKDPEYYKLATERVKRHNG